MSLQITRSINPAQLKEVANILTQAFSLKIKHLWLFSKQQDKAITLLTHSICANNGIYVLNGEHVMAFVGLNRKNNPFMVYRLKTFIACFGVFGGVWRYIANAIMNWLDKPLQENELAIDTLAVSDQARRQGLGTSLLNKVFEVAVSEGKQAILLEVINTNIKAKALYKKKGFAVTHIENLDDWTAKAGFTSVIYMRKEMGL